MSGCETRKKKYGVVIVRFGYVEVEAESGMEAMRIANNNIRTDDVSWSDEWEATDYEEVVE